MSPSPSPNPNPILNPNQNKAGCVVVQGISHQHLIPQLKSGFRNYDVVFSTWEGTPTDWYDENDTVIYNPIPIEGGPANWNYQKVSTINGMKLGKERGWERALKWRSDTLPTDGDSLFRLFGNGLNLYYWVEEIDGYVTDFFMEGKTDDIITLFDTELPQWKWNYPEWGITYQMFKNGLDTDVRFVGRELGNGVDIWFDKYGYWFSHHKTEKWFKDSIPKSFDEWMPKRRGRLINPFE